MTILYLNLVICEYTHFCICIVLDLSADLACDVYVAGFLLEALQKLWRICTSEADQS